MRKASRVFVYLCVASLLLIAALGVRAGQPGQFYGDYKVTKLADEPNNMVRVRFTLRVINNSGVDVKNATITLSSTLHRMPIPTDDWEKDQTPITIPLLRYNEHKIYKPIEATFNVPAAEFASWPLTGHGLPIFTISFVDASGVQQHERVEVSPAP